MKFQTKKITCETPDCKYRWHLSREEQTLEEGSNREWNLPTFCPCCGQRFTETLEQWEEEDACYWELCYCIGIAVITGLEGQDPVSYGDYDFNLSLPVARFVTERDAEIALAKVSGTHRVYASHDAITNEHLQFEIREEWCIFGYDSTNEHVHDDYWQAEDSESIINRFNDSYDEETMSVLRLKNAIKQLTAKSLINTQPDLDCRAVKQFAKQLLEKTQKP